MGDAGRGPIYELLKLEPCFSGSELFRINLGAAVGNMFGGRGRDRTGDPLLAKIGRTKNQ